MAKQSVKSDKKENDKKPDKIKKSKKTEVSENSKKIKKESKSMKTSSAVDSQVQRPKLARRFNKLRLKPEDLKSGAVVYIGHLPKGFEEEELKKFFT